jgi:hypothetical protein
MSTFIGIQKSGNNLFTADLTLAANRTHNLNSFNFAFTGAGNVGIGTNNPGDKLHVVGAIRADRYNNAVPGVVFVGRKARGTEASPSAVLSGDVLTQFVGRGWVNGDFNTGARVALNLEADENWTSTAQGTKITFRTTLNGTTSAGRIFTIKNNGFVGIGTESPTGLLSLQATDGDGLNKALAVRNHLDTGDYFQVTNSGDIIANGATGNLNLTSIGYLSGKSGNANTLYGRSAGQNLTTGEDNLFMGYTAGISCVTGSGNVSLGSGAGLSNNGAANVFIGASAGFGNTGSGSVVIGGGFAGGISGTGSQNCLIGQQVALSATSGAENCAFGRASLLSLGTGSQNIAMGQDSGAYRGLGFDANENPSNSVFLGAYSRANNSNQTNQIVIGHNATGEGSNTARIGNSSVTELHVGGNGASLALKSPDGTTWRISVDNSGNLVIV